MIIYLYKANNEILAVKGCTFENTTCTTTPLKSGYVFREDSLYCRWCNYDLCNECDECNGIGTNAISKSALIVTLVLSAFGKCLMN